MKIMKLKTSICTSFDYNIPFDQVIRMIKEAGFEAVSLGARPQHSGYDTAGGRSAIRKLIKENCLPVDSVHAPFPEGDRLFSLDESERLESIRQCKIAMNTASELDGRIVVIHLIQPYGIPEGEIRNRMIEQGRISVGILAAYAADNGVKLALENGQRLDYDRVLENFMAEFNYPHVGFCYDSGHENVQGTCFRILEEFGQRLLTVHLHDNLGSDTHMLPYEGNIDWNGFRKIFHALPYSGNLILEVDMKNSQFKDPQVFLSEARRRAGMLLHPPD
jgi:sugar phosphate isomerase/epimerase